MAQLWTAYFNINNDPEYAEMFNFPEATITLDEFNSDLRFPREWLIFKYYDYVSKKIKKADDYASVVHAKWMSCFAMALYFGDILPEVFKVQNIFRLENGLLKSIEANAEISKIGLKFTNSDSIQGNKIYTIKNSGETFDSVGNSFEAIEILPH